MEFEQVRGRFGIMSKLKLRNQGIAEKGSLNGVTIRRYLPYRHIAGVKWSDKLQNDGYGVSITIVEEGANFFYFRTLEESEAFFNKLISKIEKNPSSKA